MHTRLYSCALCGLEAIPIEIEVDVTKGLPSTNIVGLPDETVRESRDRVKTAIMNSGFVYPMGRITINLAPADIKKEGAFFDLAMAIGILASSKQFHLRLDNCFILGELALDGAVRAVNGIFPVVSSLMAAKKENILVIPKDNAREAVLCRPEKLPVYTAGGLREAVELVQNCHCDLPPSAALIDQDGCHGTAAPDYDVDFMDIKGQYAAVRAAEIAAAGGHHMLMVGPAGCGKTMIAERIPTILPNLTPQELQESLKIMSVAGLLEAKINSSELYRRPFRNPHHTATPASLAGGGSNARPGEVTLAHHGVLFLDEFAEFRSNVIEVLRQPLEKRRIVISRLNHSMEYPSDFMLVATMNPCRCGHYGDPHQTCVCTPSDIRRYFCKISGPILDRIDIIVRFTRTPFQEMRQGRPAPPSGQIRDKVIKARAIQAARFNGGVPACNARMTPKALERYCAIDKGCAAIIETAYHNLGMSARSFNNTLKVARTIADLEESEHIREQHLLEAIHYRKPLN